MTTGFPTVTTAVGNLIVNPSGASAGLYETPMRCGAWWITDLSPVWGFPSLRGENMIIPGAPGRRAVQRRMDEGTYVMPMQVIGDVNVTGGTPSSVAAGLRQNLEYLWSNVGDPSTGVTRLAKLILPDLPVIDGVEVQIRLSLVFRKVGRAGLLVEVTVPDGRFV